MTALKIIFAGTPEFAVPSLQALFSSTHTVQAVLTQPDRPKGRGRKFVASPVKQLSIDHKLPIYQPSKLDSQSMADIMAYEPDILVVVAYGLIIPRSILAWPKLGCINVHGSLLPDLRGAAPIQHAIMAGYTQTGVTTMLMDEGMDTGAILERKTIAIAKDDTTATLSPKLANLGAKLLLTTLAGYSTGVLKPREQNNTKATYASKITKAHAKINWQNSAEDICYLIRAINPNPVAYSEFKQTRIRLLHASYIAGSGAPGQIISVDKTGITVGAGSGLVLITHCQLPGKQATTALNLYNAYAKFFTVGDYFT